LNNTAIKYNNFQTDIQLEKRFARTIKAVLGNQFICQDEVEDLENGTDFLMFKAEPFKIGARLRRYKFYEIPEYRNQFTIRCERPSGVQTEIHKIMDGKVDYIFYGFVNKPELRIIQYFIGNLKIFREINPTPIGIYFNKPFDSKLAVFDIKQFPNEFILKDWSINNV